jgi:hypothetical protein
MEERSKDIVFILFILAVLILSILYFSVPERVVFMENQIKWWSELWDVVQDFK